MSILPFKTYLIVGAVCLGAGAAGTLLVKHDFAQWSYRHQTDKNIKQSAKDVVKSQKTSVDLEHRIQLGEQQAARVRAQLQQRNQTNKEAPHEKDSALVDPSRQLDVGTVCLLDAARSGANPDAACGSDAQSGTPSGVEVGTLVESDADVAQRYRELADRHNTLVDYVNGLLARQAGKK